MGRKKIKVAYSNKHYSSNSDDDGFMNVSEESPSSLVLNDIKCESGYKDKHNDVDDSNVSSSNDFVLLS